MISKSRLGLVTVAVSLMFSSVCFAAETATFAKDVAPILQQKMPGVSPRRFNGTHVAGDVCRDAARGQRPSESG
jgi:hypothetical protein